MLPVRVESYYSLSLGTKVMHVTPCKEVHGKIVGQIIAKYSGILRVNQSNIDPATNPDQIFIRTDLAESGCG